MIHFKRIACSLLVVGGSLGSSESTLGQVIQLPTFRQFSATTTVVVPDRGSVALGGVGQSTYRSVRRGWPGAFGNVAMARSTSAAGMSVSAYIHDLPALDAQVMQQWEAMRPRQHHAANLPAAQELEIGTAESRDTQSISAMRAREQSRRAAEAAQAAADRMRAERLLREGKPGVARIFFEMARKRESGSVSGGN